MKPQRIRLLLELALVSTLLSTAAYAQLVRTQDISYQLSPTMTVSVSPVSLGTLAGGSSGSVTSAGAIAFTVASGTPSQQVTATMDVNATSFASLEVAIENSAGQMCDLKGGSAVSSVTTCTWTIPGSVTTTYSEVIIWTTNDGISYSGQQPITFQLA